MKTILITGTSGFEGSNMALTFKQAGYQVVGLDVDKKSVRLKELEDIDCVFTDIRDKKTILKTMKTLQPDAVCHLAGQVSHLYGQKDPYYDLDVNVNGMLNFLEAIRDVSPHSHLLYSSSRSVYGFPNGLPITEKHQTKPIDAYGISKLACEHYVRLYQYHHDLKTTIFRQANLFGERQQIWTSDFQMISWIFRCIFLDDPFTFYGDGEQTRDFLYVGDAVEAYRLAIEHPERACGQIFNLGGKDYITWNRLIRICEEVIGKQAKVKYVDYPALRLKLENPHSWLSYFKAKQLLGWTPMVGVREGVERMKMFFKENIGRYMKQ